MSDLSLEYAEQKISTYGGVHQVWILPLLRTIESLDGRAKPRTVEDAIRTTFAAELNEAQWAHVMKNGRIRWTRLGMRHAGLLAGERGWWELTDLGRAYLSAHKADEFILPTNLPELGEDKDREEVDKRPTETVAVTDYDAYKVPILRVTKDGVTKKSEIRDGVYDAIKAELLPGDERVMPPGHAVWSYRVSWAFSMLKKEGSVKNPSRGVWEITEAGRERLAAEEGGWKLKAYQNSKSKVLLDAPGIEHPSSSDRSGNGSGDDETDGWDLGQWKALQPKIGDELFGAVDQRLRPDLGSTPDLERDYIPRNVIFYGPPGTGKTFVAMAVARALTGEEEPGPDSRWRIVQFHPSYAYEDFIQGLKPDLEKKELRYVLRPGPFLELCSSAEDDPDRFFVLVIDEINRGDPARIFGELLYALEYRGQPVDLPLGGQLTVPPNLIILGTMNSVDRSVALVDYALRRRFGFVRVDPEPDVIITARGTQPACQVAAATLQYFNDWLVSRLGREHALGHSLFLNPAVPLDGASALEKIWQMDVHPLLEEYFFGEPESIQEARQQWQKAVGQAVADSTEAADDEEQTPEQEVGA